MNLDLILKVNEGRGINKGIMIYTIYMNVSLVNLLFCPFLTSTFINLDRDAEDGIFN